MGACLTGKKDKQDEAQEARNKLEQRQTNSKIISGGILQPKKEFSWDKRRKENANKLTRQNFQAKNLQNDTFVKQNGDIKGQQFVIENCKGSKILLLDYISAMFIDDCERCDMIIGPVTSSIFLRTSQNCRLFIACGQLRLRDCKNVQISLFCSSEVSLCQKQPVIESSEKIEFSCYSLNYTGLGAQLLKADLDIWNNKWSRIFDFTKRSDGKLNYLLRDSTLDIQTVEEVMGPELREIVGSQKKGGQKSEILTTVKRIQSDNLKKVNSSVSHLKSLNYAEEANNVANMKSVKKINQTLNQTNQMIEVTEGDDQDKRSQTQDYQWAIPHTTGQLNKNSSSFFLVYLFDVMIQMAPELYDKVRNHAFLKVRNTVRGRVCVCGWIAPNMQEWTKAKLIRFMAWILNYQLKSIQKSKNVRGESMLVKEFVVWKIAGVSRTGNFNSLLQVIDFYLGEIGADSQCYYFNNDMQVAKQQCQLIFEEWEERGKAIN